ncbi:DNA-binding transcriptional regulator [Azospirillum sp. TSO35-2]|uniref:DNA-binding transcriptional regulator n=1 Tax=Azospirillum sp. TSO35-2 TaxID=716796 RepID=UPI000D60E386|nr:DNA-binding transcriptional regulator [Azospirillum sp. TSO35-2]PWC36010.1 transcriptional regulator [Azospirillum sp. TSO35-2]
MALDEGPERNGEARDAVRALTRGLSILRHVNAVGEARPGGIARALGIPRPTVYRLLQTLEEQGYVVMSPTSNQVRVTRLAASLGDGYAVTSRICQVAGPLFGEYAPRIVWPLDISVYENAAMVIQETTHGRSPLSIDRGMTGCRLPMLRTSAGRCYLGHCDARERDLILDHIRRLDDPEDVPFLDSRTLGGLLRDVAARGLAVRDAGEFRPQTASIAVPVMVSGTIAASLSVIWIRSAMTLDQALATLEAPLRQIAARISAVLDTDSADRTIG